MTRIPVLSFFTGGGLLDLGMEQAGFQVVWTNEYNPVFADMYEFGMSSWRRAEGRQLRQAKICCRQSISDISIPRVMREAFPGKKPRTYGIIGGPPCPDFSNGGTHSGHEGENGKLTTTFIDSIIEMKPAFFLVENVAGLFRFKKHRTYLDKQVARLRKDGRFLVDMTILNALQLGVAQSRERLFVIGCRKSVVERAVGRRLSWDETGWFPWPVAQNYQHALELEWPTTIEFGATPRKPREIPIELTVKGVFSGLGDPEKIANGKEYFNSYSTKFWERAEGDVSAKSFKRLHRFRYSPTAWYGNQEVHLHPWKPRRLSVREAMRIQSVPDEYVLPPEVSLSSKFKMICNGVPCRVAELLGHQLIAFLDKGTRSK